MITKNTSQEELQSIFIKKATNVHGHKFDYSLVKYKNNRTPVKIKCNLCENIFEPIPFNFLKQKNCPVCSITSQRNDTTYFIKKAKEIHGDNYDYSSSKYINAKTKVEIKCKKCNKSFFQLPRGHMYEKSGCPICKLSHGEEKILLLLKFLNITFYHNYKFKDCIGHRNVPLKFDFYLPDYNTCIEFDGKQHSDKTSKYWSKSVEVNDNIKNEYCICKNVKLKRISYKEINNIERIIKTLIL